MLSHEQNELHLDLRLHIMKRKKNGGNMRTKILVVLTIMFFVLLSTGCAPGNTRFEAKPAGFFAGLWHGFICVFTFIISLFSDSVEMYEVNNGGNWYNFGFLLGASCFFGGSGRGSKCRKK